MMRKKLTKPFFVWLLLMLGAVIVKAQTSEIVGVVKDETGQPLVGASVQLLEKTSGKKKGVTTAEDGKFKISGLTAQINYSIDVSFVGYETKHIENIVLKPAEQSSLLIQLKPKDASDLDQVVVTALGIKKSEKSITYATQKVNLNALGGRDPNVANLLSGKVAGLQINNAASGAGASSRIVLRGNRSISGDNQALIIVDGVPLDNTSNPKATFDSYPNSIYRQADGGDGISSLNPEDIESINVLKGASGAALYGSRASNGVIIITTKKGKGDGSLGVNVNATYGIETPDILREYQNTYGQGNGMTYNKNAVTSWGPEMDGTQVPFWSNNPSYSGPATYAYSPQNNNIKDFFRTGSNYSALASVTGGNERSQTYFSYAYTKNQGIIPTNDLERHNISLRNSSNLGKHISIDSKINYINQNINGKVFTGENDFNPARQIYRIPRNISLSQAEEHYQYTDVNGNLKQEFWAPTNSTLAQNPYWILNNIKRNDKRDRILGFVSAQYKFTEDLSLQIRTGLDTYFDRGNTQIYNDTYVRGVNGDYRTDQFNILELNTDFLLTWKKKISQDLSFTAYGGGNLLKQKRVGQVSSNTQLLKPNFFSQANALNQVVQPNYYERRLNSLYGYVQLNYKDYMFLDLTGRNDWSSTLPAANRSYFYPSAGLNFILSSMFKLPEVINYAKIRGAFAQVGNDALPYLINPSYNFTQGGANGYITRSPILPASNLKPEKTSSIEIGGELKLFKDRLGLDFTWYKSNSINQLITVSIPSSSAYTSQYINAGNIQNRGVEFVINAVPLVSKDFKWNITANYSQNISLVKELADNVNSFSLNNDYIVNYVVEKGKPYGAMYVKGFQRDANGNVLVGDNGLPLLTPSQSVYVGNFNHKWIGGLTNQFTYKNFTFSFLIDTRMGGKVLSFTNAVLAADGLLKNTLQGRDGSYLVNGINTNTKQPNAKNVTAEQYWTAVGGRNTPTGEVFVYDATNIRLREVGLSYQLPQSIIGKTPFSKATATLYGRNLFFLVNKAKDFDPEVSSGNGNVQGIDAFSLPYANSYGLTLNFSF